MIARRFCHPGLGWSVELPEGTEAVIDVPPAYLLPHASRWGFRPAMVITSGPAASLDEALGQQATVLEDPMLLDRRPIAHPAGDGEAVVIHHVAGGRSLTLTQWWLAARARMHVLSATCATPDYNGLADVFVAAASSFRLGP